MTETTASCSITVPRARPFSIVRAEWLRLPVTCSQRAFSSDLTRFASPRLGEFPTSFPCRPQYSRTLITARCRCGPTFPRNRPITEQTELVDGPRHQRGLRCGCRSDDVFCCGALVR